MSNIVFSKNETYMTQLWLLFSIPVDWSPAGRLCSISHELAQLVALFAYETHGDPNHDLPGLVKHTKNDGKITMFNGKIHYKWSFSIAMLVHQRVNQL